MPTWGQQKQAMRHRQKLRGARKIRQGELVTRGKKVGGERHLNDLRRLKEFVFRTNKNPTKRGAPEGKKKKSWKENGIIVPGGGRADSKIFTTPGNKVAQ